MLFNPFSARNFKNILKYLLIIFCTGAKKGPFKGIKEIIFKPHKKINYKLALKVYIVQTFSEDVDNLIKSMDTIGFMNQKNQLKMDYPFDIKIWEIDLLSEQKPKCVIPPSNKRFFGLYIFFRYIDNREESKITFPCKSKSVTIKLEDGKFKIEKLSKRKVASDSKQKRSEFCIFLPEEDNYLK